MLENADLILSVGYDIVEYAPAKWNSDQHKNIIHIDARPAHINKLYQPSVEVVGDISVSLRSILSQMEKPFSSAYAREIKLKMEKEYAAYEADMSFPMRPQKVLSDVRKVLAPDDILLSDVGAHKNVDCPPVSLLSAEYLSDFQWVCQHGFCFAWCDCSEINQSG